MTDKIRKSISEYFKEIFLHQSTSEVLDFITSKVRLYNRSRLPEEPEMTFDEMVELLQEKITTYRGKA
jgi:hypothetical protein